MPEIPFTADGFVNMGAFDATDPDALTSLTELGADDVVPTLGDDSWHSLLDDVFEGSVDPDVDVDSLVGDDAGDESPFEIDELWGGGDEAAEIDEIDTALDDESGEIAEDDDLGEIEEIDVEVEEVVVDDTGAGVAELLEFGDDDLGSGVGELVDFDDEGVGIEDDLDALENTDFDT